MDYSLALQFFALMLLLICMALVPFVMRRDPVPVRSIVQIDVLPRSQWPGTSMRVGLAGLIASFALLLAGCYLVLIG